MSSSAVSAAAPHSHFKGIGLYLLAYSLFAVMDTLGKYSVQFVPAIEASWFRYLFHLLILMVVLRPWRSLDALKTKRPAMHLFRSLIMAITTVLSFAALGMLQLATFAAIMISTPLMITALAGPLLGDWAGPRRWAAVIVGFVGVLIVTWPGADGLDPSALVGIGAAVAYAGYALTTRTLATTETTFSLLFYSAILPMLIITPMTIPVWVVPDWRALLALGIFGAMAVFGHMIYINAFRHAPATVLAPFQYSQAIWLPIIGWIFFTEVPGNNIILGGLIIIASGLYVIAHERKLHQARAAAATAALPEAS